MYVHYCENFQGIYLVTLHNKSMKQTRFSSFFKDEATRNWPTAERWLRNDSNPSHPDSEFLLLSSMVSDLAGLLAHPLKNFSVGSYTLKIKSKLTSKSASDEYSIQGSALECTWVPAYSIHQLPNPKAAATELHPPIFFLSPFLYSLRFAPTMLNLFFTKPTSSLTSLSLLLPLLEPLAQEYSPAKCTGSPILYLPSLQELFRLLTTLDSFCLLGLLLSPAESPLRARRDCYSCQPSALQGLQPHDGTLVNTG